MNCNYNEIFERTSCMRSDVNLYIDSVFMGFEKIGTIQEYFEEYRKTALDAIENVSWDYIVLYAVICYGKNCNNMISANFMTLELPYGLYRKYVVKFHKKCRSFFLRGRKEILS